MVRFLGRELNPKKAVWVSLQAIYGVGIARAKYLCARAGVSLITKTDELRPYELNLLTRVVEEEKFLLGDFLRAEVKANIQRLKDINCRRGIRHTYGLPVHGQRTKSNAKTAKRLKGSY
mmetsp:Transcript_7628/g.13453  ORF Transcript_7628/g.13453 Transcript_7628/m.13453 type:complete len:119 (-) Transcript_7628:205-561(-)